MIRTVYTAAPRVDVGSLRADEVQLDDLIAGVVRGTVVSGVVDRRTVPITDRPVVRLRLHDPVDGSFAHEGTYDAGQRFRVRRLATTDAGDHHA